MLIGILIFIAQIGLSSFWCRCWGIGAFINIDLKYLYSTLDIVSIVLFSFLSILLLNLFVCFLGVNYNGSFYGFDN